MHSVLSSAVQPNRENYSYMDKTIIDIFMPLWLSRDALGRVAQYRFEISRKPRKLLLIIIFLLSRDGGAA